MRTILICSKLFLVTLTLFAVSSTCFAQGQDFSTWLKDFRKKAISEGIDGSTYDAAFHGITAHDPKVLEKAAYQPEFTQEVWDYIDTRVNDRTIGKGEMKKAEYAALLGDIEKRFGVPPSVILAIWSMETNYGEVLKVKKWLHYVPQALATLGWGDPKRQKFGKSQLIAALTLIQDGDITRDQMMGSWAGAMGHTQFIPTSYLAYGVDMDGDGRRDIWNSVPDALATAANLLAKNGWVSGKTWGYEIVLPAGAKKYEGETRTLAEWQKLGFYRPAGRSFPRPGDKAVLKLLAGDSGPGFLMMRNFFVIKKYNNSDFYALGVGQLADRIAGWGGMVQPWPRPPGSLTLDEKYELQRLLKQRGYYDGVIDGYVGPKSRKAIKAFQSSAGLSVDGKPDQDVLQAIKKK